MRRALAAAVGAATASSLGSRRRQMQGTLPCACEVRLWGPRGSRGRSETEIAAEAALQRAVTQTLSASDFAREGPLYSKILVDIPTPSDEDWTRLGGVLAALLAGSATSVSDLDPQVASRIYHLYLPLYFWMRQKVLDIRASRDSSSSRTVVFGLSAPQGCGKSTLVEFFKELFKADGMSYQAVSLDDFYVPGSWQEAIAEVYESNALLQTRGNAGTHDVGLGAQTLRALKSEELSEVSVPKYDKSAREGKGDRAASSCWKTAKTPCDVVVLEGWMLGFKPRRDTVALKDIHPGLSLVNEKLERYQDLDDLLDAFVVIGIEDTRQVHAWRLEAERAMKSSGRPAMDDDDLRRFVNNYIPAYDAYCQPLYDSAAHGGVDGKPSLLFFAGENRLPVQ